jgi:hypothetical protein
MKDQEENDRDELERILFNIKKAESTATEGFSIDSSDKAAWAARKIIQAEARIARQSVLADEYRHRIETWYEKTCKRDLESIEYLKGVLKPYTERTIAEEGKGKSLRFPGITLSIRKLPDRLEITDETLALRHCERTLCEAVETKKTLIRSEVKKALTEGLIIPGVDIIPGKYELYVMEESTKSKEKISHVAA